MFLTWAIKKILNMEKNCKEYQNRNIRYGKYCLLNLTLNFIVVLIVFFILFEAFPSPAAPGRSAVVTHLYFTISWIFWEQTCCSSPYIPMLSPLEII
jgi:hypothetical protein